MSRRTATMALAAILLVGLLCVAWLFPVPFVAMSPGPTENTLGEIKGKPIVEVVGHKTYPTTGQLDLTTVAVTSPDQKLELLGAIGGWLDPTVAVVPRDYIYPPDQTPQQVEEQNAEQMEGSQQNAIAAALRAVGETVTDEVLVQAVVKDAPAVGKLKAGDILVTIDGTPVHTREDVVAAITKHKIGDEVEFEVRRDGKPVEVKIRTVESTDQGTKRPVVGITPANGYEFPFDVKVNLGQDIGGPSAGTMFALAIVDKLTPGPLTDGKHVAGTGVIDGTGKVGPIGGIQQKVAGARSKGATVFLVPADNCEAAAQANVKGIQLVRVATLRDAIDALTTLSKGGKDIPSCQGR
jgi:PDZ domain-containing protein